MRSKMAYAGVCIGVFATGCSRDNGMHGTMLFEMPLYVTLLGWEDGVRRGH